MDETKKLNDKEGNDSDDDDGTGSWKTVDSADEDDLVYDETKALPSTSCLFCNNRSDTVEGNLEHMTIHGFFIPDAGKFFLIFTIVVTMRKNKQK